MQSVVFFIEQFIIPLILAVGLVMFIYGIFNYYFMGPSDEERREIGRQALLWANFLVIVALIIYLVFAGVRWLGGFVGDVNIDVSEETKIQRIPIVPQVGEGIQ